MTGNIGFLCDIPGFKNWYDLGEFSVDCTSDQKSNIAKLFMALDQSYNQIDSECEWDGVVCNANGAVIKINLGKFF